MTNEMDLVIRPAHKNDEESLFELACALSPRFIIDRSIFATSLAKLIESEDVYLQVAEGSSGVVGYLLGWSRLAFYSNGPVGWVQEVVVKPDDRRHGIGKRLMNNFENWIAFRGGLLVSLATSGARDFYLALGYAASATYYKKAIERKDL